jgi:hypothetical protein
MKRMDFRLPVIFEESDNHHTRNNVTKFFRIKNRAVLCPLDFGLDLTTP